MARLLYTLALGLFGAGIVHIAVLLLLPHLSEPAAWTRLAAAGPPYRFVALRDGKVAHATVRSVDPMFQAAACRFDLGDGIVQVTGGGQVPFWSLSIYDRGGQNVFSFNDRVAQGGELNVVILTAAQMIGLRKELTEAYENAVFIEAGLDEGIVTVRAFVPDESWRAGIAGWLGGLSCAPRQERP